MKNIEPFKGFDVNAIWAARDELRLTEIQESYLYRIVRGGSRASSSTSKSGRNDWLKERIIISKWLNYLNRNREEEAHGRELG